MSTFAYQCEQCPNKVPLTAAEYTLLPQGRVRCETCAEKQARTTSWAHHIVNRESGCNPGAVNTKYSVWREQAQCIAQMIPKYHKWIDYGRCKRDLRYAIEVFVRLSRGGTSTGPWG